MQNYQRAKQEETFFLVLQNGSQCEEEESINYKNDKRCHRNTSLHCIVKINMHTKIITYQNGM